MPNCSVLGCKNHSFLTRNLDIHYFTFPKDPNLSNRWVDFFKKTVNLKSGSICSIHFEESAFTNTYKLRKAMGFRVGKKDYLKKDAVPTKYPPAEATPPTKEETIQVSVNPSIDMDLDDFTPDAPKVGKRPRKKSPNMILLSAETGEIAELKIQISILQKKVKAQQMEIDHLNNILKRFFTMGQIKCLKSGKQFVKWSSEDISSAISLRSVSPKAYRYLRTAMEYPLPAITTLRRWVSRINFQPGILSDMLALIKYKSMTMNQRDRVCVISFDEVYISNSIAIDRRHEQVVGPHKTAQTVMARGLFNKWKQIIYYDFDRPMTKALLFEIITQLHIANFVVVAVVSDLGPTNLALRTSLNVGHEEHQSCWFPHPQDTTLKVFFFNDAPHIIKLARNNLFDGGFKRGDEIASKQCIERLFQLQSEEIKLTPKVTQFHLEVYGQQRQNVKLAAQILSHTVAQAIIWCGERGLLNQCDWKYTAKMIKLINDWFDLFNSKTKFSKQGDAFGVDVEKQLSLIKEVDEEVINMRVGKTAKLLPFQKAILTNNKALTNMYNYLKEKYNIEYILTYRLNQDVLENFFSYIRGVGGANDHPTALDYQYRIRWYVMGKHSSAAFVSYENNERDKEESLITLYNTEEFLTKFMNNLDEENEKESQVSEEEQIISTFQSFEELENAEEHLQLLEGFENFLAENEIVEVNHDITDEGLKYIAGYLAFKCKHIYVMYENVEMDHHDDFSWTHTLLKGNLLCPNEELLNLTKKVKIEFNNFHGKSLSKEKYMFKTLTETLQNMSDLPKEVIKRLVRVFTYIRVRELNRKISVNNTNKKNKIKKFVK